MAAALRLSMLSSALGNARRGLAGGLAGFLLRHVAERDAAHQALVAVHHRPPATLEVGWGPLVIPNMAALVKGAPNAQNARRLLDFLLSEKVERLLAESDSHNIPVRAALVADPAFAQYVVKDPMTITLDRVAERMSEALRVCDDVLGD